MQSKQTPYKTIAIVAGVAAVAFFAGIFLAGLGRSALEIPDIQGFLWPNPPTVEGFSLIDDGGEAFSREQLLGHWSFLFFGFSQCPDVCPTTMQVLKNVKTALADDDIFRNSGQVVFVSVDPERDTSPVLRQYLDYFDPAFIGISGPVENLKALTRPLGILFGKIPSGDTYTMDHSASILLVDPVGRVLGVFSMPHEASQLSRAFKAISEFYVENAS